MPTHGNDGTDVEAFQPRVLPVVMGITVLGAGVLYALLWLAAGPNIDPVGAALAGAVLPVAAFFWARRLTTTYPVLIHASGVQVYGLRGGPVIDAHWLEWSEIAHVSRINVIFIPCIILRRRQDARRYWIPASVIDAGRFRELVQRHAGQAHPLTWALRRVK